LPANASLSKLNVVIVVAIVASVTLVSVFSYANSERVSEKISELASQEMRTAAKVSAHDLALALTSKFDRISANLVILTKAPTLQSADQVQGLLDAAQLSTADITEGYYWLDSTGRIVTYSDVYSGKFPDYRGNDLSFRDYFQVPARDHTAFASTVAQSVDGVSRMYVSQPILSSQGDFHGVVVAAIRTSNLPALVESRVSKEISSVATIMVGNDGTIVESQLPGFVGGNMRSPDVQSKIFGADISSLEKERIARFLEASMEENASGSGEFSVVGKSSAVAYSPVSIAGKHYFTLYVTAPYDLESDVGALLEEQQQSTVYMVVALGAVSTFIVLMILSLNKRLKILVDEKTLQLKNTNESLASSNRLLTQANQELAASNLDLADANEKLAAKEKAQREFVNIAAHELRTPITPIVMLAEVAAPESGDESVTISLEQFEIIKRNAKRLQKLSADLLEVAKIDDRALTLNREVFSLNGTLADIIADTGGFTPEETHARIELAAATGDQQLVVNADRSRLYEVVSNLVKNAIRFSEGGKITVSLKREGAHAVVSVKDAGKGIDPEISPLLFNKFASFSDAGGTGLGLFISKNIVEAHGGKIWAENNKGGPGATFSFTLPLHQIPMQK
jgi:signal transduction histidine kinase